MLSRRWFYFIPANGEPRKLVHRIEPACTRPRSRQRKTHLSAAGRSWKPASAGWSAASKTVAMEYVPRNANPYVSRVDAGTVELVRVFGVEVVPSGDLIQLFEACWDDEQWAMHLEAARHTDFGIRRRVRLHRRASPQRRLGRAKPRCSNDILDHFANTA